MYEGHKIFVAASWPRRHNAATLRDQIQCYLDDETIVKSRWIDVKAGLPRQTQAELDWEDMLEATVFVQLTGDTLSSGGRHTELGMAIARRLPIFCIGGRDKNVYHWLPHIKHYGEDDMGEFLDDLITELSKKP